MAIRRLRRWSRHIPVSPYPYLFGNQRYCWYNSAWNGPGWYYCGYAFRRGYGWGGGYWLEQLALERTRGTRRWGHGGGCGAADTAAAEHYDHR